MSEKSFKFVSPTVQIQEIDDSASPGEAGNIGPIVIGRAERGPAMRPVFVSSYSEFIEYFGESIPDTDFQDVWRDGLIAGPSYGALAAQASLRNKNALTYIRLLGTEHPENTAAGVAGWKVGSVGAGTTGGAYGLFVFPSGTAPNDDRVVTGTLAAVWYIKTGSIALSGTRYTDSGNPAATGTAGLLLSNTSKEFRVLVKNENGSTTDDVRFSFSPTSDLFIRKVFNTNTTKLNSAIFTDTEKYFLGESYEDFINNSDEMAPLRAASQWVGVILGLKNNATQDELSNRNIETQNSRTGWFFAQDFSTVNGSYNYDSMAKLFKFHSLDSGEWNQSHLKVSIRNVRRAPSELESYGSFDVVIRRMEDSDANIVVLEQFPNCNLNPKSPDYICRKIGDKYITYDTVTSRNRSIGQFENRSKFIRVEVSEEVAAATTVRECLPFGVYGPVKFKNFSFTSSSLTANFEKFDGSQTAFTAAFVLGSSSITGSLTKGFHAEAPYGVTTGSVIFWKGDSTTGIKTASVIFPYIRVRSSSLSGNLGSPTNAYFGVYTDDLNNKFSPAVKDTVRILPNGVSSFAPSENEGTDYAWIFTLDDLMFVPGSTTEVQWRSGSRLEGTSLTAQGLSYNAPLTGGFNSFTTVLAGGFDGLDVTELEPFRNSLLDGKSDRSNYAYNSIKRAINLLEDERLSFNLAAVPGITVPSLTSRVIEICENRGDAFAIIDLEDDFVAREESTSDLSSRHGSVKNAIASLRDRGLNTNCAATYFPWVQAREPNSDIVTFVPPSVVVLGAIAYNDKVQAAWWAPAGFNRAALSDGHGGIPVVGTSLDLNQKDRDDLYNARINPIATIADKIVIWGQKTLQIKKSALDRVNVKRCILEIKKQISTIAYRLAFEPNSELTWMRFKREAEPILRDIVSKNGLEEFKIKLDSSTVTPDLIDRNIIYGKVFLKPTRTAEFFGFDFNITNAGAAFTDL